MLTLTPDLLIALREQYIGFPPDCDHGVIVQSLKLDSPAYRLVDCIITLSLHSGKFFMLLLSSADFFQNYFKRFFQEQYRSLKRFRSRSGRTRCLFSSGSKLFAKVILLLLPSADFLKINFFKRFFQKQYQSLKWFGSR